MKQFDTLRFLSDYGIDHRTKGKSVSRKYTGVECPFCEDTGHHLGIHNYTGFCTCWFCGVHSLYDTIKLLTNENPKSIIENYSTLEYVEPEQDIVRPTKITVPGSKELRKVHYNYLNSRGYDAEYIVNKYDLHATVAGSQFPYRIVIPIYYKNRIISYQKRTYINSEPKYLTCAPEYEIVFHKDIFYNLDNCYKDSVLVVEGIFDVFRFGDNCIAGFGTELRMKQLLLLKQFKKVYFLYDSEEEAQKKAKKHLTILNSFGILCERILLDSGDPGDMSQEDAWKLKSDLNLI